MTCPGVTERVSGRHQDISTESHSESQCVTARLRQVPLTHWARGSQDRQLRTFPPGMHAGSEGSGRVLAPGRPSSPRRGTGAGREGRPRPWTSDCRPAPSRSPSVPCPAPGPHHRRCRLARSSSSAQVAAVPGAREEAEGGAGPARRGRGARLL